MQYVEIKSSSSKNTGNKTNENGNNFLRGMNLNATSLENKIDELRLLCKTQTPHIVAITETWFKNTSLSQIDGYTLYKKDRNDGRRGGGVAFYVDSSINSYESNEKNFKNCNIEHIWVIIERGKDKYLLGCIYRPPDLIDLAEIETIFNQVKKYILNKSFTDVLIMGDFNLPEIRWTNGLVSMINKESPASIKFCEIINESYLFQHVTFPTFQMSHGIAENTLDLIFTSEDSRLFELKEEGILGDISKAHLILTFKILTSSNLLNHEKVTKFAYNRGDFRAFSTSLERIDWSSLFFNRPIQDMYDLLILKITDDCNQFIPIVQIQTKDRKKLKWINIDLKRLIRQKKNLRFANCASGWKNKELAKEYKSICKKVKTEIKLARNNYENDLINKAKKNPKLLYQYVNNQRNTKSQIRALKNLNGEIQNDGNKIADILNNKFQEVFVRENILELPILDKTTNGKTLDMTPEDISQEDVFHRLSCLDPNKATGPDNIHPIILKNLAKAISSPLTIIFKESIKTSVLPIQWRSSNITALYKKGDRLEAGNYRPVSLTSIPCKVIEGIIRKKLEEFFYENELLVNEQHGFVKSKSCTTNLLETLDYITYYISQDIPVDEALLDFKKAFDSLAHRRLGVKLDSYGIIGFIFKWIMAFLKDRRQRVILGEFISKWMEVYSGVPQGSVIGPFLFVIFINDLKRRIQNVMKIYADDTKLLARMLNDEDKKILQNDLDEALKWSKEWLLDFNIDKCLVMHYGLHNNKNQYSLNGKILPGSDSERDLGVVFNTELKWTEQAIISSSKANQMIGILRKSFNYFDENVIKTLYCAFVRPLIEFAAPVWNPYLQKDIDLLEQVQHKVKKLIPALSNLTYEERLEKLGLSKLVTRRERGDLIQMFKIINGIEKVNWIKHIEFKRRQLRDHHDKKYNREIITKSMRDCTARHNFFTNRIAKAWNELPENVIEAKSVNSFKARLDKYYQEKDK